MDPTYRLRTATRLHFLLLRRYGQDIDVSLLLKSKVRKHDGLWLCKATGDAELISLARLLVHANRAHAKEEALMSARATVAASGSAGDGGGATQRDMPWARDTSGFGATNPQELTAMPQFLTPRSGRWLNPLQWLKSATQRGA